ncbi:MAG: hypothetical protein ACFFCM_14135 [Promethearchaeota archaeon]
MPLSNEEIIERIINLTKGLNRFWSDKNIGSWAPKDAATLLKKSRIDWQDSLTKCLRIWLKTPIDEEKEGRLILAWTNLGTLVEGSMKLFLSVWYEFYKKDDKAIRKKGKLIDPDELSFNFLKNFFKEKILDQTWVNWIHNIQIKRNAIHAYKNRDIGSFDEFYLNLRKYLEFLHYLNNNLPYPDDEIYKPRDF